MSRLAGDPGHRLGQLGLARPGRALDQHRLGQPVGQVDDPGDAVVGQVARPRPGRSRTSSTESNAAARDRGTRGDPGADRASTGVCHRGHRRTCPSPWTTYLTT